MDAERDADEIILRAQASGPVYALRAGIREELGRPAEALADYRTALERTADAASRRELTESVDRVERILGRR